MYNVSITNNYIYSLFADGGNRIIAEPHGGKGHLTDWGSHSLNIAWMGDVNFIDLGEKKLEAYTNPKIPWTHLPLGGLIRYRGLDAYFRYEGRGQVDVVVDEVGSVHLHFPQGGMIVHLDDLTAH